MRATAIFEKSHTQNWPTSNGIDNNRVNIIELNPFECFCTLLPVICLYKMVIQI